MTASWENSPCTWEDNTLIDADVLNEEIRDRFLYLKDMPSNVTDTIDEISDFSTGSTSFVDVDEDILKVEITTTGGDILVGFTGSVGANGGTKLYFTLYESLDIQDNVADDDGIVKITVNISQTPYLASFMYLLTDMSEGTHIIKLRWKSSSANLIILYAGAGTGGSCDIHPQFWAREV